MGDILTFTQLYNSLLVLPILVLAIYLGIKIYLILNEILLKKTILGFLFISGIILVI